MKVIVKDRFLLQSVAIHFLLIVAVFALYYSFRNNSLPELVEFRLIEAPTKLKQSKVMPLKAAPVSVPVKKSMIKKKKKGREVFGVTKKSLTTNKENSTKTKLGNTISKKVDQKNLKKEMMNLFPCRKRNIL